MLPGWLKKAGSHLLLKLIQTWLAQNPQQGSGAWAPASRSPKSLPPPPLPPLFLTGWKCACRPPASAHTLPLLPTCLVPTPPTHPPTCEPSQSQARAQPPHLQNTKKSLEPWLELWPDSRRTHLLPIPIFLCLARKADLVQQSEGLDLDKHDLQGVKRDAIVIVLSLGAVPECAVEEQ